MLRTFGKYEDRRNKEQHEEVEAKLRHDKAAMHFSELLGEKDEIKLQMSILRREKRQYERELNEREDRLRGRLTEPEGTRFAELEAQREKLIARRTRVVVTTKAAYPAVRIRILQFSRYLAFGVLYTAVER